MPRFDGYYKSQKDDIVKLMNNSKVSLPSVAIPTDKAQEVYDALKNIIKNRPTLDPQQEKKDSTQNAALQTLEKRSFALQEFISTYLKAFVINVDDNNYDYSGNYQSIIPLFVVYGKDSDNISDWKLLIEMTKSAYSSFDGIMTITYENIITNFTKNNFNPETRHLIFTLPNKRNLTSYTGQFPIKLEFITAIGNTIYTFEITEPIFNNLSLPSLSYQKASYIFEINKNIDNVIPIISNTGTVPIISWNIQPQLPEGLTFTNGVISGKPTELSNEQNYTITVINKWGGTDNTIISLSVQTLVIDGDFIINYESILDNSIFYDEYQTILSLIPTISSFQTILKWSINPSLPNNLSINEDTGIISGSIANVNSNVVSSHTITAINNITSKSATYILNINIKDLDFIITGLENSYTFLEDTTITDIIPTTSPIQTNITWEIVPALTNGLIFDSNTGKISGKTNNVSSDFTSYHEITAKNNITNRTAKFDIVFIVKNTDFILTYPFDNYTFIELSTIPTLNPSINPSQNGLIWTVDNSYPLPTGLSIDSNGFIAGIAPEVPSNITYITKIKATNTFGKFSEFMITFNITNIPFIISYPQSSYEFKVGDSNIDITPIFSPTQSPLTWTINPSLPTGLSFDGNSGRIFGSPTETKLLTNYTITANGQNDITDDFILTITISPSNVIMGDIRYQWLRWLDSSEDDINSTFICTDKNNNVYLTGFTNASNLKYNNSDTFTSFNSTINIHSGSFTKNAFIAKYNPSGVLQWFKWICGAGDDKGYSVISDSENNVYFIGQTNNTVVLTSDNNSTSMNSPPKPGGSNNGYGTFIVKFNTNGLYQWFRWIDGTSGEFGMEISVDSSNNIYITGYSSSSTILITTDEAGNTITSPNNPINTVSDKVFIIKYNSSGTYQWTRWIYRSPNINQASNNANRGYNIKNDKNDNVYILGYTGSATLAITTNDTGTTIQDLIRGITSGGNFLIKYNSSGVYQWIRWINGTSSIVSEKNLSVDLIGNVYISDYTNQISFTFSSNSSTLINSPTIPITYDPSTLAYTYIVKYNSDGDYQWFKWLDGLDTDVIFGMNCDNRGNLYITGHSKNNINIGSSNSNTIIVNKPYIDNTGTFIIIFNETGEYKFSKWIDGTNNDLSIGIVSDNDNNIYITGTSYSYPLQITDINNNLFDAPKRYDSIYLGAYVSKFTVKLYPEISYSSSNFTLILNQNITNIQPITSGEVISYLTIVPNLPIGLIFNDKTGVISGKPTETLNNTMYTITAFGENGTSTVVNIYITVSELSNDNYKWLRWLNNNNIIVQGIKTDANENIYIVGSGASNIIYTTDENGTTATEDAKPSTNIGVFILKFNSSFGFLWSRWIDGTNNEYGESIAVDSFGDVYVSGYFTSNSSIRIGTAQNSSSYVSVPTKPSGSGNAGFVIKYNTSGTYQWMRWVDASSVDQCLGICASPDNFIYVNGVCSSTTVNFTTSAGGSTATIQYTKPGTFSGAFVAKYNTDGAIQWVQWVDGTSTNDYSYGVYATTSNVYLVGTIYNAGDINITSATGGTRIVTNPGAFSGFVVKFNSSGTYQWNRWIYGSTATVFSVVEDSTQNVYITGKIAGNASITTNSFNSFVSFTRPENTSNDLAFITKFNSAGDYIWFRWIGGNYVNSNSMCIDSNNIYITGAAIANSTTSYKLLISSSTTNTYINSPARPLEVLNNGSYYAVYVAKFGIDGSYKWLKWVDSNESLEINKTGGFGIDVKNSNLYIAGAITSTSNEGKVLVTSGTNNAIITTSKRPVLGDGSFILKLGL